MNARHVALALVMLVLACPVARANASVLSYVSDLISTSAPSATSTHQIRFTVPQAIPAGGKIVITPDANTFTVPTGFDYTDVDLAIASGGPYVDRTLAASASAVADGVAIVSSGRVTITLNSTTGIGAGEQVEVELGANAMHGVLGEAGFLNPTVPGAYHIRIATYDATDVPLDYGSTVDTVVLPVSVSSFIQLSAPLRFNGLPTSTIAAGTSIVELSFETDEPATCRYATTTDIAYASMTNTFTAEAGEQFFYTHVTGFTNGQTYSYYVRCIDLQNYPNDDDYIISFTLAETPSSNTSIVTSSPTNGSGGVGPFPYGSATLYFATVSFNGWAMPGATVTVLKDGVVATNAQARDDGSFKAILNALERGSYTFQIYATDSKGVKTGTFSTTLALNQGSTNAVSNIVVPPSAAFAADSIAVGEDARIVGESVPGSAIRISMRKTNDDGTYSDPVFYTATTTSAGRYDVVIPGKVLSKGGFIARARATRSTEVESEYGKSITLGVGGKAPSDKGLRADLNRDGKVNLVDFSILLSFWGTKDADADIDENGTVALSDFSVMLFYWTG